MARARATRLRRRPPPAKVPPMTPPSPARRRREADAGPRFVLDPSLSDLAYRCADGCPRGRTCCTDLTVEVSPDEVRRIDSIMDEVARLVPELREGGGYENVFVDDPPDLLIEARDDGSCPFLHRTRNRALCSIHTIALRTGRHVPDVKPAACRHWPIVLESLGGSRAGGAGGGFRVTVQAAARGIGCVAPVAELPHHPRVIDAFRDEILEICGEAVRPLLPPARPAAGPRPAPRA